MRVKNGMLTLTAASVLAVGTAMAAEDPAPLEAEDQGPYSQLEKPAEPQDQVPISVGPQLNPPEEARTRELPPEEVGGREERLGEAEPEPGLDVADPYDDPEPPETTAQQDEGFLNDEEGLFEDQDRAAMDQEPAAGAGMAAGAGIDQGPNIPAPVTDQMISNLQSALQERGYDIQVDGIWGPNTYQALQEFQNEQNIQGDGQINTETLAALNLGTMGQAIGGGAAGGQQQSGQQQSGQQQAAGGGSASGSGQQGQQAAAEGQDTEDAEDIPVSKEIDQAQRDLREAEQDLGQGD